MCVRMPTTSSAPIALASSSDQTDGVFAGVIDQRGQIADFAAPRTT